jgi:hypothetical protein
MDPPFGLRLFQPEIVTDVVPERPLRGSYGHENNTGRVGLSRMRAQAPSHDGKGLLIASWTPHPQGAADRPTFVIVHGGHGVVPYGAPVIVFTGGKDTAGPIGDCDRAVLRAAKSWKHYPDATHGWDVANRGAHSPAVDGECGNALNVHHRFPICRSDAVTEDMRTRITAFLLGVGIARAAPHRAPPGPESRRGGSERQGRRPRTARSARSLATRLRGGRDNLS